MTDFDTQLLDALPRLRRRVSYIAASNQAWIDDIVQSAALKALEERPTNLEGPLLAWLTIVARHFYFSMLKESRHQKERQIKILASSSSDDRSSDPHSHLVAKTIIRAFEDLDKNLIFSLAAGKSPSEIQAETGRSRSIVNHSIIRVRDDLANRLGYVRPTKINEVSEETQDAIKSDYQNTSLSYRALSLKHRVSTGKISEIVKSAGLTGQRMRGIKANSFHSKIAS